MLRVTTCFVFLEIVAVTKGIEPRSVNLALETVLAFDHNDNSANIKFIDDVQNFLTKVRKVIDNKPVRRNLNNAKNLQFTDFVTKLIDILNSYEDKDLEDAFAIIDDEIRKYHYKGCKFYELVTDHQMRRYVAKALDVVKGKSAKDIRRNLDATLQAIQDAKFDTKQTDLLDYINSLYTKTNAKEFQNILDNLQMYKSKSRRADIDLKKAMRHSIRSTVFDHYSKLNINTRRDFKVKLDTFWHYVNKLDKLEHNMWSMTHDVRNNETTPLNNTGIDNDNVQFLKELLEPYKKVQIKTVKGTEDKQEEFITNEEEATVGSTDTDDNDLDTAEKSINIEENKLTSLEESLISTKEDGEGRQTNSQQFEKKPTRTDEEHISSKDSTDNDVEVQHEPEDDSSNNIDDNKKGTPPLFIDLDSKELKKHKMHNMNNGKSKKKITLRNKKMSSFVTLYPERITRKLKKRDKIESTTSTIKKRMHTLWIEKITPINKHRNKVKSLRETNLVAPFINAEVNVKIPKTPIGYGHREIRKDRNANKPKTESKGGKKIQAKEILNNDEEIKRVKVKKDATYLKSRVGTLQENNELRFLFNLPKNARSHPKQHGSKHKKAKKGRAATTPRVFELEDNSPEEETIGRSIDKSTTKGLRAYLKEKSIALESTEEDEDKEEETNENEYAKEIHELTTPELQNMVDATEKESVEYSREKLDQKKLLMVTKLEGELASSPTYEMAEKSADTLLTTVNKSVMNEQSVEEPSANSLGGEKTRAKIKRPMDYKQAAAYEDGMSIESYEIMKPLRKSNNLDVFLNKNSSLLNLDANETIDAVNTALEPIHDHSKQSTGLDPTHEDQDYFSANVTEASNTLLNYWPSTTTIVNTTNFILENISTVSTATTNTNDKQEVTKNMAVIKTKEIQETTEENEPYNEIGKINSTENPNTNDTETTALNTTVDIDVVALEHNQEATKTDPEASTDFFFRQNDPIKVEQISNATDALEASRKNKADNEFYSHEIANGIPSAPDGENRKVFGKLPSSFDGQIDIGVGDLPTSPDGLNTAVQSNEAPSNASDVVPHINSSLAVSNDELGSDSTVTSQADARKKDEIIQANIKNQMDMELGEEDVEDLTTGDMESQTPPVPQRKLPKPMAYAENIANVFDIY